MNNRIFELQAQLRVDGTLLNWYSLYQGKTLVVIHTNKTIEFARSIVSDYCALTGAKVYSEIAESKQDIWNVFTATVIKEVNTYVPMPQNTGMSPISSTVRDDTDYSPTWGTSSSDISWSTPSNDSYSDDSSDSTNNDFGGGDFGGGGTSSDW